jgi:uncharacterized secreted protein with C-terminal beta-propeller domain
MTRGLPAVDSDALMTDASTVYASPRSLVVATERWAGEGGSGAGTTQLHRFEASARGTTAYRASGEVRGHVLNQFSLSELDGRLRVATTEVPEWIDAAPRRESESFVTVLEERAGRLAEVGRVGGLGRGERIFAVRFIGDVGYVVTFRQVDPLYTVDLSNPASPRVLGELKIRGYSAYLHPVGEGLLLGVGQDATAEGRQLGTQVSLFDVSDLRAPRRLHAWSLGSAFSSSAVEFDHHAFLWWPPAKLAVVPVEAYDREPAFAGAVGLRVDRSAGIAEAGRVRHADAVVRRSLVAGGRLLTISEAGVKASSLDTLADVGWAAFPRSAAP